MLQASDDIGTHCCNGVLQDAATAAAADDDDDDDDDDDAGGAAVHSVLRNAATRCSLETQTWSFAVILHAR